MSVQHKDFKQQPAQSQIQTGAQQVQQQNAKPQQVQKEPINKEQTATAQTTVQVEGLEPVQLQLADQDAYRTQVVQNQNIAHVTEPAPLQVIADSFDDALMALTYQDFTKMVGTYNRGQVELVDGKLQIINNHRFSKSTGKESVNHRLVRERFLVLAIQQLGDQMTPELHERLWRTLQLDQKGSKMLPLTRKEIHDVLADVNMRTSEVSKVLFLGSQADPVQAETAKRADGVLAGKMSAYDRSHITPETQKRFREEISQIFERAKRNDKSITTLSQHEVDNLISGNIELVRDQIYHALNRCYEYRSNICHGEPQNAKFFFDYSVPVNVIAAYVIKQMAAVSEVGQALAKAQLEQTILRVACGDYENQVIKKQGMYPKDFYYNYTGIEVGPLSAGGSDGLEEEVLARMEKNKKLREDRTRTEQGMRDLASLSDHFRELTELKEKGLKQGLSQEESDRMNQIVTTLVPILKAEKKLKPGQSAMGMVAAQLKGTRFAEGYDQIRRMLANNFDTSIKKMVNSVSLHTKRQVENANQSVTEDVRITSEQLETNKGITYRLDMLEGHAREIASVVFLMAAPSELVKKADDPRIKLYQDIHDEMIKWKSGGAKEMKFQMQGISFTMSQAKSGLIDLLIDDTRLTLPVTAGLIADALETDMVQHEELYGREQIKDVLKTMDPGQKDRVEWTHSRMLCLKYLQAKTGKHSDYFNNLTTNVVRRCALYLLSGDITVKEIEKIVRRVNKTANQTMLNGVETLELIHFAEEQALKEQQLASLGQLEEVPKVRTAQKEDEGWTEEERQIKDLIADCIAPADTWIADQTTDRKGMRLQKMLEQHVDTLVILVREPQKLEDLLNRIPMLQETGLTEQVHHALGEITNHLAYQMANQFLPDEALKPAIRVALHTDYVLQMLIKAENELDEMMQTGMIQIQAHISDQAKELFGGSDTQTGETKKTEETEKTKDEELSPAMKELMEKNPQLKAKYEFNKSVDKLGDMMREAASGARGQGLFMQLVLKSYFAKVPPIDRRTMFASALRNAKPMPDLPEDATQEEKNRANRKCMGANLGGFLKGAGPLMHKMLQGLPTEAMPEELRGALKDMKSNLAPIPEEIVKAQMDAMIARSHGQVDRIEIMRALGAASVGQAFLCKLHGPNLPAEGKNVVIKLLRPDVRNRMEREKPIMRECAKNTDENDGMLDTYDGQLLRIEEELDLTLEAKNVNEGKVYDKDWATVKSMKLSQLIEPTTNSMVVECAPGTTVDKFLEDVRETTDLLAEFYSRDTQGRVEMIESAGGHLVPKLKATSANVHKYAKLRKDMFTKLEQLKKRQVYMTQLAETWVTEGIFGEGFYHGDLHAGNIMVDDDGLTVIDFGNATKLTEEQQVNVTRMVAAAAFGDMKNFRSGLHNLLEYKDEAERQEKEAYFLSKEQELGEELEKIFTLGNFQHSGQRIAVALLKAQELGIQVPPAIFNFSQCQIRLQNALDEMNGMITTLQQGMETIHMLDDQVNQVLDRVAEEVTSDQTPKEFRPTAQCLEPSKEFFITKLEKQLRIPDYESGRDEFARELYPYMNRLAQMEVSLHAYEKDGVPDTEKIRSHAKIGFSSFKDFLEGHQMEQLKQEYIECLEHPQENEQRFADLMKELRELVSRDIEKIELFETDYKLLYDAVKLEVPQEEQEAQEEQITLLKERLFERYKELSFSTLFRSQSMLGPFRKQLENPDPQAIEQLNQMLKPLFEDESYGGTLQAAYQEFREAQRQNAPELQQKEWVFLEEYRKILKTQYADIEEAKNFKYRWENQDSFFGVMAGVISSNLMASLKRLGTAAVKYGSKLNEVESDNRDYDKFEQELKEVERRVEAAEAAKAARAAAEAPAAETPVGV